MVLEEWRSVMPHEDDQTVETFKFSLEEWFTSLLPDNAFLTQKEWMINTMKQPYTMKVKGFGNRLKILYCYLTCMTQEDKIDTVLTHTSLKALFLKSMTLSWQNAYLLKVHTSNNFWQMILYFVQLQSITDNQMVAKASSASHSLDTGNNTNMCVLTMDMVAVFFPSFRAIELILTVFNGIEYKSSKAFVVFWRFSSSPYVFSYMGKLLQ